MFSSVKTIKKCSKFSRAARGYQTTWYNVIITWIMTSKFWDFLTSKKTPLFAPILKQGGFLMCNCPDKFGFIIMKHNQWNSKQLPPLVRAQSELRSGKLATAPLVRAQFLTRGESFGIPLETFLPKTLFVPKRLQKEHHSYSLLEFPKYLRSSDLISLAPQAKILSLLEFPPLFGKIFEQGGEF